MGTGNFMNIFIFNHEGHEGHKDQIFKSCFNLRALCGDFWNIILFANPLYKTTKGAL